MRLPKETRAFVTGGASGLGRALAVALGGRGARVLVGDIQVEGAEETAHLVREAGGQAAAIECDVTRAEALDDARHEMDALYGGTDLLVNNAGVAVVGPVGSIPLEDWRFCIDVNLWGVIHGCHAFVPGMRAQRSGFILNVASAAAFTTLPEMGPYNVTKAGVVALSATLAGELASSGIRVSALCPTFFPTGLMKTFRTPDERLRRFAEVMFRFSHATADGVARSALKGLERGTLVVIPQVEGRLIWRLKRLFPGLERFWGPLTLDERILRRLGVS